MNNFKVGYENEIYYKGKLFLLNHQILTDKILKLSNYSFDYSIINGNFALNIIKQELRR